MWPIFASRTGYAAGTLRRCGGRLRRLALHVLLLAVALGGVLAPLPAAPRPERVTTAPPPVVLRSWQVAHPLLSGTLSGLAWGRWPRQYGDDALAEAVQRVQGQGYGVQAFTYVQRLNQPLFQFGRIMGGLLLYGVLAVLFWRARVLS